MNFGQDLSISAQKKLKPNPYIIMANPTEARFDWQLRWFTKLRYLRERRR